MTDMLKVYSFLQLSFCLTGQFGDIPNNIEQKLYIP